MFPLWKVLNYKFNFFTRYAIWVIFSSLRFSSFYFSRNFFPFHLSCRINRHKVVYDILINVLISVVSIWLLATSSLMLVICVLWFFFFLADQSDQRLINFIDLKELAFAFTDFSLFFLLSFMTSILIFIFSLFFLLLGLICSFFP